MVAAALLPPRAESVFIQPVFAILTFLFLSSNDDDCRGAWAQGEEGEVAMYISRTQAVRKLQLSLQDFRYDDN